MNWTVLYTAPLLYVLGLLYMLGRSLKIPGWFLPLVAAAVACAGLDLLVSEGYASGWELFPILLAFSLGAIDGHRVAAALRALEPSDRVRVSKTHRDNLDAVSEALKGSAGVE